MEGSETRRDGQYHLWDGLARRGSAPGGSGGTDDDLQRVEPIRGVYVQGRTPALHAPQLVLLRDTARPDNEGLR